MDEIVEILLSLTIKLISYVIHIETQIQMRFLHCNFKICCIFYIIAYMLRIETQILIHVVGSVFMSIQILYS